MVCLGFEPGAAGWIGTDETTEPTCLMTFLGYCIQWHFLHRTAADTFWPIIGQNWPTFYSNIWSHWQSAAEKKTKKVCREAFESGKKAFRVPPSARACARVSASSSVPFLLELAFRFLANHWMPETFHFLPKLSLCRLRALSSSLSELWVLLLISTVLWSS